MSTPVFLQSKEGESGAICLAMLLGHYGSFPPLTTIKIACDCNNDEILPKNLNEASRRFGLDSQLIDCKFENLPKTFPFIIFTKSNKFLLITNRKGGMFIVHNPDKGKQKLFKETLYSIYNGQIITANPTIDFNKITNNNSFANDIKKRVLPNIKELLFVLLAGLILLIPAIVIPALNKVFFDEIIFLGQSLWFKPMISFLVVFFLLGCLLVYLQQIILLKTELKMSLVESAKFVLHILKAPYFYFQNHATGDTIKRILLNDAIAILLSRDLTKMLLSLLSVLFYGIIMVKYNWVLTLAGVSIMLINIFALRYFSAKRTAMNQALFQKQQATFNTATNGIQQIETLKSSGAENDFFSLWSSNLIISINENQRLGKISRFLEVLPDFLSQFTNVVVILLGGLLIMKGEITVGVFIAMQSFLSSFSSPVKDMVEISGNIQLNRGNMNNLNDSLDEPIDPYCDQSERTPIDEITPFNAKLTGKLEVKNLGFGYSKFAPLLLEEFSLDAFPGKRIAIVGGSGSGKSTLLKVIAGLYPATKGEILYDDISINKINSDVLRNSISMVEQETFFFTGTIADNITMWNRAIDNDMLISAAKDAAIHDVISERQDGYQLKLSPDGGNFSGGQRQRLEIARALVTNPSILFLDEATSALDTETERLVMGNFKQRKCTTITIAHRLSTIKESDEIIVLEKGKVIQRGNHDELMKMTDGLYFKLINES